MFDLSQSWSELPSWFAALTASAAQRRVSNSTPVLITDPNRIPQPARRPPAPGLITPCGHGRDASRSPDKPHQRPLRHCPWGGHFTIRS
jgi:hypothetical protein